MNPPRVAARQERAAAPPAAAAALTCSEVMPNAASRSFRAQHCLLIDAALLCNSS
jgi:hypothetical protein